MNEVLREVVLDPSHRSTDNARHFREGQLVARPHMLQVVRLEGAPGVYPVHLDPEGQELTDTWHTTVEDACDQARFEFGVDAKEWREVPDQLG